ncbi:MAG: cell division ATP-binding protein FtsE [candidate division FCPU426 bacterium]
MIEFQDVSKTYEGDVLALKGVTLSIARGEFVFLTGPSGAGKSSLLDLLTRERKPSSGYVRVDGIDLGSLHDSQVPALRRRMGIILQDFRLLYDRSVFDNVSFALRVLGLPEAEIRRDTEAALEKVGLAGKADLRPHKLSGGEQQRVAVARALARDPEWVLADEPTGNLDAETSMDIFRLLQVANQRGATVVVATHNQSVIQSMGKRVVRMRAGLVESDAPEEKK